MTPRYVGDGSHGIKKVFERMQLFYCICMEVKMRKAVSDIARL